MAGPRYSIIPADALADDRVTDLHLRVLAILASHSDANGWLQINQKNLAARAKKTRETINRAIRDLAAFGYVRKRGRVGEDGRRLTNKYQVVLDREPLEETREPADHVTPTSQGVCDPHVTGYVTSRDHRGCDPQRSQQVNDLFLERPSSKEDKRPTSPKAELAKVLDAERANAVVEHRQRIRKPLTGYGARLLADKLARVPDPNTAADAMIANGWIGFEPEWLGRQTAHLPAGNTRPRDVVEAANARLKQLEREEGATRAIEHQ